MSTTRPVRPTDVVALVSFDGKVYSNEARTWERLGSEPEQPSVIGNAVEQWFSFATGRHTWVSIQGQTILGLVSARRRGSRAAWEVDCLIAADANTDRVGLSLFDQLSAGAARAGVHKLFLRLEAGSDLLLPARKAGFVAYATEHLLRLEDEGEAGCPLSEGLTLRPRERADEHGLFQLYNSVAPPETRMVEAMTLTEWAAAAEKRSGGRGAADLVAERDGRIVGRVRTYRAGSACRLDVIVTPEEWPATDALLGWAIRDLGSKRPILAAVAGYARPVAERMVAAGFEPAGEYTLLAKRLMHPVFSTQPVRARVKPVATV